MPSEFDLNPIDLYDILRSKGINQLFHANTVATSITFLNEAHLLSRKYVEDNKLFQTAQYSDEKDKAFDIYDDIFVDFRFLNCTFLKLLKYLSIKIYNCLKKRINILLKIRRDKNLPYIEEISYRLVVNKYREQAYGALGTGGVIEMDPHTFDDQLTINIFALSAS